MNSEKSIAELAYRLWNQRGRPHGSADEDWLEAERQLGQPSPGQSVKADSALDVSLKESFPASDPAGSQRPDVPPANAEAKWTAAGKKGRRS